MPYMASPFVGEPPTGDMPPGYRFYPTEEELVLFYLRNKLAGKRPEIDRVIPVVHGIYQLEPWQLPKRSGELCRKDTEQWFFFTPRPEREVHGGRPCRTLASGYWKSSGSPDYVYSSSDGRVIGLKKTMVFYKGKAGSGKKTKWKMNEYRAIETEEEAAIPRVRHELSLCRVYVVWGSFRGFERRPVGAEDVGAVRRRVHRYDGSATRASQESKRVEKAGSSESSSYLGEEQFDVAETKSGLAAASNGGLVPDLEPLWEWEQLNLI
ncbi:NAC domain-containing protein 90-like [Diospyros lotus]|uniref:NAC domain-containing protein 90-like n=1 Tax=Diospyros lotus TaxID=55363 RepID=UPI002251E8FB|nr:NAC domain-containing protein 90-like [Diospyros lotus]